MRQAASKNKNSVNNEIRIFSFYYGGKKNNVAFISPNPTLSAKRYEEELRSQSISIDGCEPSYSFRNEKTLNEWAEMMKVRNIIIVRE